MHCNLILLKTKTRVFIAAPIRGGGLLACCKVYKISLSSEGLGKLNNLFGMQCHHTIQKQSDGG